MKISRLKLFLIICGLFLFIVFYKLIRTNLNGELLQGIISDEYKSLFVRSVNPENIFTYAYKDKVRNPTTVFDYSGYSIIIYKIGDINNRTLKDMIHQTRISNDVGVSGMFGIVNQNFFEFNNNEEAPEPLNNIYLTFNADTVSMIEINDSSISFDVKFRNIYLRYSETGPVDIHIKKKHWIKIIPANLMFAKRNNSLYIIVLTLNNNAEVPENFLSQLVK
jgi:hypothetical protein